jgi:integrase/recombinase XerC
LNPHILTFSNYLKFEKRYSPHTIRAYTDDLTVFFTFLQDTYGQLQLTEITGTMVRTWLASIKEEKFGARTINRKISSLKSFFKYQLKQEEITSSPMGQVISPKLNKRLPNFIKETETETIFKDLEFGTDWKGQTNKLILKLLYQTGMRLSELINLKCSAIDFNKMQLKVLGKGNKERILPLNAEVADEIRYYEAKKKDAFDNFEANFLLLTPAGKKLYAGYVYQAVKWHLSQATTIQKKSPHVLRHTFATHMMNNGADLNAVKDLLGHASLAATQVYTHNTIEKLKNVHKKSHPKA